MKRGGRCVVLPAVLCCAMALSAGCVDDGLNELQRHLLEARDDATSTPRQSVTDHIAAEPVEYRFEGSSSPFRREKAQEPHDGEAPVGDQQATRASLQGHALKTLSLAGTLRVASESWGLVETLDGQIHLVGVGEPVGRNNGRIVAIKAAELYVVEAQPDGNGGMSEREVRLVMDDSASH